MNTTPLFATLTENESATLAIHFREWRDHSNYAGKNAAYPYAYQFYDMAAEFDSLMWEAISQYEISVIRNIAEFTEQAKQWHAG